MPSIRSSTRRSPTWVEVLAVLAYTPAWASTGDTLKDGPNNDVPMPGTYAAYVTAAVNHLKDRVTYFEILERARSPRSSGRAPRSSTRARSWCPARARSTRLARRARSSRRRSPRWARRTRRSSTWCSHRRRARSTSSAGTTTRSSPKTRRARAARRTASTTSSKRTASSRSAPPSSTKGPSRSRR